MPLKGFVCYSRADGLAVDRLEVHLKVLGWEMGVEFWRDQTRLAVGETWTKEIHQAIGESQLFLLALTPEWFNSKFIKNTEWPAIQRRLQTGSCLALPVVLKKCQYDALLSGDLALLATPVHPETGKIVPTASTVWDDEDGYDAVAKSVREAIKKRFSNVVSPIQLQSPAAIRFEAEAPTVGLPSHGAIARISDATDAIVAQTPIVQQLHAASSRTVGRLQRSTASLANQHTWKRLLEYVTELNTILSQGPLHLPAQLGPAWSLLQGLTVSQSRDIAIHKGASSEDPVLSEGTRDLLDEALESVASLLGCFPTVTDKIVPGLIAVRGRPIPTSVIEGIVNRAIDQGLLNEESGSFLGRLMEISRGDNEAAGKIRAFLQPSSRNLSFFILSLAASTVSIPDEEQSPLQRKASKFAQTEKTLLIRANKGSPSTRAAIESLGGRLKTRRSKTTKANRRQATEAVLPDHEQGRVTEQSKLNELSEAIHKTLPFLRRYARAVFGSQTRGDEWVRVCAELVVQQPQVAISYQASKLQIFALFHRLRPFSVEVSLERSTSEPPGRLKESLSDMNLGQRTVLLLTVLEGFTVDDAAYILNIAKDEAEQLLEQARRELQRVAAVKVLVIEDEAVVALDIADIVRNAGHQVVGIAATEKSAIELAKEHTPHLILADIQLRGEDSGIRAVNAISEFMTAPVIFVTGYPERLLTGKQVEPAFVISKPFDPDLLRAAIAQALDTVSI